MCAGDRTNSRLSSALAERIDTARRDLRNAKSCGRIRCPSTCRIRSNSTSGRVIDRDGGQSERDALYLYLGESEEQCIDKSETRIERRFRREAEIAVSNEVSSILSGGESLIASVLSCVRTGTTRVRIFLWLTARPPSYPSVDVSEASPEVSRAT